MPMTVAYARLLAGDGVEHGHIGPREVPRLWERHLLNCAVVADLLPQNAVVVDVGSGAGLPGVPLAIRRPDLAVTLVEPMLRRTRFLEATIASLGLDEQVRVLRGRAEDRMVRDTLGPSEWILARAVAPLDRLVRWCVPLLSPTGRLLAMKGSSAAAEALEHEGSLRSMGATVTGVVELGTDLSCEPTWVVSVEVSARTARARRPMKGRR